MPPVERSPDLECRPFKQRKCLAMRKDEVTAMRKKFPRKLPVIVERYPKEKVLPGLEKTKFLVPQELTLGQFAAVIRNRMPISPSQAVYFLVNNQSLVSMSLSMAEVHAENRDEDGFLYITYASQEAFG
ncbi:microtubule-associated proteins 1A/1B light chain 3C-like [Rhinatrema bivittatum]|uniref:microtubule-associated proteins 1A/1B light chain 3C-like n=1 Tax=Rhinatrema bivittatum TaxID=194408 RepID=UPI001129784F|nr:microtubule-associated proteins 1A/1B light chain 3C-like [Rhinatrema bivittatum]